MRSTATAGHGSLSSARRQKGLTGYCFKYIDRPFCLQTDTVSITCFSFPHSTCKRSGLAEESRHQRVTSMTSVTSTGRPMLYMDDVSCCQCGMTRWAIFLFHLVTIMFLLLLYMYTSQTCLNRPLKGPKLMWFFKTSDLWTQVNYSEKCVGGEGVGRAERAVS